MKGIGSWGEKLVTMMLVNLAKISRSLVYSTYLSCFIDNGFYSFDKKLEQHFQHAYYTSFGRTV